ncbi:N-methyl-L-tryptophan oxidase [Actinoplanes sp. NPDC051346]|uniref:N-methyl-L-tryptophan oxidase n=1 Tax=Actinoplanes sp. NPDC051346 TaxID=3155048 RepID=UPI003413C7CC
MAIHDVIVIGLGGMGSAAAYHLAARGQRVLGLEQFGPAHDRGASHGGSRIIRQSYFESPEYVPLLLRAYELWEALAHDSGRDVMTLTGGIMVGLPDSVTVAGSRRSAEQWDLPHELLDAADLRRRFPVMTPAPGEIALHEDRAGFVRPELTVRAHLDLAARHGADLRFHEPMTRWEPTADGGVRVDTESGTYTAGRLVLAPGPWAPRLLADLGLPFVVERQVQYWFQPSGGVDPFRPEALGVYIWEDRHGSQVYGFPAIDGPDGGAKIAFFRRGVPTTPETVDREVDESEIATMAARARQHLPDLPGAFLRAKTCLYCNTPDEHFVIAAHPAHPSVTVACGFSGHGFKFVPVVGEILADLVMTGTTAHPIGLFDPDRLTEVGS